MDTLAGAAGAVVAGTGDEDPAVVLLVPAEAAGVVFELLEQPAATNAATAAKLAARAARLCVEFIFCVPRSSHQHLPASGGSAVLRPYGVILVVHRAEAAAHRSQFSQLAVPPLDE